MNYLTNYYKNLSEQLETKLRALESQAQMLNEAMSSQGAYDRDEDQGIGVGEYGSYDGANLGALLGSGASRGVVGDYINRWRQQNLGNQGVAPAMRSARTPVRGTRPGAMTSAGGGPEGGRGRAPGFEGTGMGAGEGPVGGGGGYNGAELGRLLAGGASRGVIGDYINRWQQQNLGNQGVAPAMRRGGKDRFGRDIGDYGMGAGEGGNIPGDYNGDGVVDGADLGLALGRGQRPAGVVSNWGGGGVAPAMRSAAAAGKQGGRGSFGDAGFGGGSEGNIPGDYNGDGRVDGADLGLALGGGGSITNTLSNWSRGEIDPYSMQTPTYTRKRR
jgi:hypothetical protein